MLVGVYVLLLLGDALFTSYALALRDAVFVLRTVVEDFKFHLTAAMRAVGIGLVLLAWVSVLGSEAQLNSDMLIYVEIGAALIGVTVAQWFTSLPNQQRDKPQVHQARRRQSQ